MFAAVVVLFVASGFSSLIYQVVWTRMLVLVFGGTTFATSTVLAIFMGGLALGSLIAGRYADRLKRPLLWYGILEAIIGAWALFTPMMFEAATPVYRAVWQATHAGLLELSLVRFACTLAILIVPTTCMGATLPILARFVTERLESVGNRVGTLYAVNTLGAVAGAIATGFVILPGVGLHATIVIAAAINALLFVAVLAVSKMVPGEGGRNSLRSSRPYDASEAIGDDVVGMRRESEASESHPLPLSLKLTIGAFAISGGLSMVYEVCWTRTLLMVIGSTTYAFTIMLSAFLVGIFFGSLVCAKLIDRARQPVLWFAVLQLLIAASGLLAMRAFNFVPYWNLFLGYELHGEPNATMVTRFLLAGGILSPIAFFMGATFPAVVKACITDLERVGRSIGFLYSANTVGAIVGAFLAGFVCLPLFGAERTLIYSSVLNALLGLLLLWFAVPVGIRTRTVVTGGGIGVLVALLFSSAVWDKNIMLNAQTLRRSVGQNKIDRSKLDSYPEWKKRLDRHSKVRFWADGACSNVGVVYRPVSRVTSLITNGHIDASDSTDISVQSMLAEFPLLAKLDTKEVAIVGWGCGQTVATALKFPVTSVDAIELEPMVLEASKHFHHLTHAPENDPRVHLHFHDGRNFLLATDKRYDAIISEPSNPWQSGVCNLFTKEYFAVCKQRLKDDGVLSLWVQTAEIPPDNLRAILAAVNREFKNVVGLVPRKGDVIVLASESPIKLDFARIGKDAADVAARVIATSEGMRSLGAGDMNTDDRNRLEFDVARTYEDKVHVRENFKLLQSLSVNLPSCVDFGEMSKRDRAEAMARIADSALDEVDNPEAAAQWCEASIACDQTSLAYRVLGALDVRADRLAQAIRDYGKAVELDPKDVGARTALAKTLIAQNRLEQGRAQLEECLKLDPHNEKAAYMLASSFARQLSDEISRDTDSNSQTAKRVLSLIGAIADDQQKCSENPNAAYIVALAYMRLGDFGKAKAYVSRFQTFASRDGQEKALRLVHVIDSMIARRSTLF
jgi:spermidine synthase